MKRILSLGILLVGLNANTLSLDNANLTGNKTIYFNNAQIKVTPNSDYLNLNNKHINLQLQYPSTIQNPQITKLLGLKAEVTQNEFNEKIYPQLKYFTLNGVISDMLLNPQKLEGKILVQDNDKLYYVAVKRDETSIYDKLKNQRVEADKIYLKILKTIQNNKIVANPYNILFEVDNYNGDILRMKFKDKLYNLERVYNRYIDIYKQKESTLETTITKQYDVADDLTSVFVLNSDSSQYRLKFHRYLNPKNRNIINSNIEVSNKIFKPNAPLEEMYRFESFSFNVPHQLLFELQGIFKEDTNVIYKFENSPKERYVHIKYRNNENKKDKSDYFKGSKSYYTFSNFINLLEWMRYNKKVNMSIMMFFDTIKPVNYDISITDNSFKVKKGTQTAFYGTFNKYGYVKEINFNNKKLVLEDLYSTKTLKNKRYLKQFKLNHHIIELKDNK